MSVSLRAHERAQTNEYWCECKQSSHPLLSSMSNSYRCMAGWFVNWPTTRKLLIKTLDKADDWSTVSPIVTNRLWIWKIMHNIQQHLNSKQRVQITDPKSIFTVRPWSSHYSNHKENLFIARLAGHLNKRHACRLPMKIIREDTNTSRGLEVGGTTIKQSSS